MDAPIPYYSLEQKMLVNPAMIVPEDIVVAIPTKEVSSGMINHKTWY